MDHSIIGMIFSGAIFLAAYILIILDKPDRTVVALSGAALMILVKVLDQRQAFAEIDFNTLGLLIGMMVIVMTAKRSGVFEYAAVRTAKLAGGDPVRIIILLSIVTGLFSALLDNVTTILLILPVTLSIARDLHINPVPFIITEIFASNTGGAATLIGDPPNIMIAGSVGFDFMDFLRNSAPIALPLMLLSTYLLMLIFRKKLAASREAKTKIMLMDENACIKDRSLMIKSLVTLAVTIAGFMLQDVLHYESATVAVCGAVILLLTSGIKPERIFHEVEWKTIFFFAGLFIMVGGIREAGLIALLAKGVLDLTNGNATLLALSILWVSAAASAFIDNIPFVATMIPLVKDVGTMTGMNLGPVWWALSLGACLGGNGTIIGASANVIAAGISEEHGHRITFGKYFKAAFPIMILNIAVCTLYLYLFYLI